MLKSVYVKGIKGMTQTKMYVSPSGKTVYTNLQDKLTFFAQICQWIPSQTSITCRIFDFFNTPFTITPLSDTTLYSVTNNYDYGPYPYKDTYLILTDFTKPKEKASLKIPCLQDQ
jgi:hypothetical protein